MLKISAENHRMSGLAETQTEGSVCDPSLISHAFVHSPKWDEKPGKSTAVPEILLIYCRLFIFIGTSCTTATYHSIFNLVPRPRLAFANTQKRIRKIHRKQHKQQMVDDYMIDPSSKADSTWSHVLIPQIEKDVRPKEGLQQDAVQFLILASGYSARDPDRFQGTTTSLSTSWDEWF